MGLSTESFIKWATTHGGVSYIDALNVHRGAVVDQRNLKQNYQNYLGQKDGRRRANNRIAGKI